MKFNWCKFAAWIAASLCGGNLFLCADLIYSGLGSPVIAMGGFVLFAIGLCHCSSMMFAEGSWFKDGR